MARVQFIISYEIAEQDRNQYMQLVNEVLPLLNANGTVYTVFEDSAKKNFFAEVYLYPSEEAFEAADDAETPAQIEAMMALAKDHKVKYQTMKQIA
jgi:hypothetical protein